MVAVRMQSFLKSRSVRQLPASNSLSAIDERFANTPLPVSQRLPGCLGAGCDFRSSIVAAHPAEPTLKVALRFPIQGQSPDANYKIPLMIKESEFLEELQSAITNNRITLPTLPEVALNVRDAVEQEDVSAKEIADIIATDAALAARLLQIANCPLYRGRVEIENIQMAVTRLGNKLVRSLVISIIMKQMFQATSDALDMRMRKLWEDSVQIAAISRVLAQQVPGLDTGQALLAGLIHDIGALPILAWAEADEDRELVEDEEQLDRLLENLGPVVGKQIMQAWRFPQALADVAANSHNYYYEGGGTADYVDVVIAARIQSLAGESQIQDLDWSRVSAFARVGLDNEIQVVDIEGVAENIAQVEEMFG